MTTAPIPDPYAVLGVSPDATDDDLDHAFRSLVRQLHPDTRTPSDPDNAADERLQDILAAYAGLRDPVRRAAYDRSRSAIACNPPGPQPRVRAEAATSARIRVTPAVRVGPVHWQPPARGGGH